MEKVLITGGNNGTDNFDSAELYDPSTGTFSVTDDLNNTYSNHTAILLLNEKVFIFEMYAKSTYLKEFYDATLESFSK